MPTRRIDDHDLFWLESGGGTDTPPLLMIHGSLCDARYWAPQMAPLGAGRLAIAVSLRRCWPEAWDGQGEGYSVEQHVDDLVAFIGTLGSGAVDVMGHSRGGHVAYRLALKAPRRVRKLVLAEPGGLPDASLGALAATFDREHATTLTREAATRIADGDIDGGLAHFVDGVSGMPIWTHMVPSFKRMARDNARTLIGQVREKRLDFTREDLASLAPPTLLIGGALTPSPFPELLDLLQSHIPDAQRATIAAARHAMNLAAPAAFNANVLEFLGKDREATA